MVFLVLYDIKLNMFGFWTVWTFHHGLWEFVMGIFNYLLALSKKIISRFIDNKDNCYLQPLQKITTDLILSVVALQVIQQYSRGSVSLCTL